MTRLIAFLLGCLGMCLGTIVVYMAMKAEFDTENRPKTTTTATAETTNSNTTAITASAVYVRCRSKILDEIYPAKSLAAGPASSTTSDNIGTRGGVAKVTHRTTRETSTADGIIHFKKLREFLLKQIQDVKATHLPTAEDTLGQLHIRYSLPGCDGEILGYLVGFQHDAGADELQTYQVTLTMTEILKPVPHQ